MEMNHARSGEQRVPLSGHHHHMNKLQLKRRITEAYRLQQKCTCKVPHCSQGVRAVWVLSSVKSSDGPQVQTCPWPGISSVREAKYRATVFESLCPRSIQLVCPVPPIPFLWRVYPRPRYPFIEFHQFFLAPQIPRDGVWALKSIVRVGGVSMQSYAVHQ